MYKRLYNKKKHIYGEKALHSTCYNRKKLSPRDLGDKFFCYIITWDVYPPHLLIFRAGGRKPNRLADIVRVRSQPPLLLCQGHVRVILATWTAHSAAFLHKLKPICGCPACWKFLKPLPRPSHRVCFRGLIKSSAMHKRKAEQEDPASDQSLNCCLLILLTNLTWNSS